jgi:hypothetical protein
MNKLFLAFLLIVIAQSLTYLQLQSQFFWKWAKDNPLLISIFGAPISLLFIKFTQLSNEYFTGQTWPGRLIGFAIGAIVFAVLSNVIMNEELSLKTIVCLCLACCILLVQFFWK